GAVGRVAQQGQVGGAAGQPPRRQPAGEVAGQVGVLVGVVGQPRPVDDVLLEGAEGRVREQGGRRGRRRDHGDASPGGRARSRSAACSPARHSRSFSRSRRSGASRWTAVPPSVTSPSTQSLKETVPPTARTSGPTGTTPRTDATSRARWSSGWRRINRGV